MSMLNGLRIVASILNGAFTSAQLNTALGSAMNAGGWQQVINNKLSCGKLVNNTAAMEIVVRSALALAAITPTTPFYSLIAANRMAIAKLVGASAGSATVYTDIDTLTADATAMGLVAASVGATALLANSTVAMASFALASASVTAFASVTPLGNLAKVPAAISAVTVSPFAFNLWGASALRKVIGKSASLSVWFKQLMLKTAGTIGSTPGILRCIESNGTNLVAAHTTGLAYSTDSGQTWTAVASFATRDVECVRWVPFLNLFVALVSYDSVTPTNGQLWTSPTGVTWTSRTINTTTATYSPTSIAVGPSSIVITGFNGSTSYMEYSTNATAWSIVTPLLPTTISAFAGCAYGNGRFVAMPGNTLNVMSSADGSPGSWDVIANPGISRTVQGIKFANGQFIVSSATDNGLSMSTDGANWTLTTGTLEGQGSWGSGGQCVPEYANGLYIWPYNVDCYGSADAKVWSRLPTPNSTGLTLYAAGVHDGTILVGTTNGRLYAS